MNSPITKKLFALTISSLLLLLTTGGNGMAANQSGEVLETQNAANYTYLHLKQNDGDYWVAIPQTEVKVGDTVTYLQGMEMKDFHAKTLDRTFPSIIFSPGLAGEKTTSFHGTPKKQEDSSSFAAAVEQEKTTRAPKGSQSQPQFSAGSAGATVPFLETRVSKAEGDNGFTVGEIYAEAKKLDGKKIRVRGKVVKVSANIMGKNWIHLQDGTGDPMKNSHDLVVTSSELPEKDKVFLIEGVMAAGKDFGYGYTYDAILEDGIVVSE